MKLKQGLQLAYDTHWSMINTFKVEFQFGNNNHIRKYLKVPFDDSINLCIKNITTPDFQNQPIESFVGNRWRIQNGRDELYKFQITFRDKDQMSLYKSFYDIYRNTREQYFDYASFTVIIYKEADNFFSRDRKFMELNGVLIESVSNISFSNETSNEIAEFTVNFKCVSPNVL